jgi:hypothetical protein
MKPLLLIPPIIGGYFLDRAMEKTCQMKWIVGLFLVLFSFGLAGAVLSRFVKPAQKI